MLLAWGRRLLARRARRAELAAATAEARTITGQLAGVLQEDERRRLSARRDALGILIFNLTTELGSG